MIKFFIDMLRVLAQELRGGENLYVRLKLIITVIAIPIAIAFALVDKQRQEAVREQNLVYHKQVESLNQVEANIKQLMAFVDVQKQQLKDSQDVLNGLKTEEQSLRPVVEADRKVVDAVLDAQQRRSREAIWRERIISFGLGVLASLIASVLYSAGRTVARRRREAEA